MRNESKRQKYLGICFFLFIALTFGSMRAYPWLAGLFIFLSLASFYFCRSDSSKKMPNSQECVVLALFYIPTFFAFALIYNDEKDARQFLNYLQAHACEIQHELPVPGGSGKCNLFTGACDEQDDSNEAVYRCPNGNEITFKDFVDGNFSYPAK